jgi:hypothetical protein
MTDPTHTISLRVGVDGPEQFSEVWQSFSTLAVGLGLRFPGTTLSSYLVEAFEDASLPGEKHDDQTLNMVSIGLREAGLDEDQIMTAINSMLNNGILFREKS